MSASALAFDDSQKPPDIPRFVRANSQLRVTLTSRGSQTAPERLFETGGLRLRFPNRGDACEGVMINVGGGIVGGDRVQMACRLEAQARAVLTTQSAEKIYRAEGAPSHISVQLMLAEKSHLAWVPQETILYDGAKLQRDLAVEMAANASLTLLESTVFGRLAHKERLGLGLFRDSWRVRRAGQLIFAEDVKLEGGIADTLDRLACGQGARAIATLLHVDRTAEKRLAGLRRTLSSAQSLWGASAFQGFLVARFLAPDPSLVRADVKRALEFMLRGPVPRVWSC